MTPFLALVGLNLAVLAIDWLACGRRAGASGYWATVGIVTAVIWVPAIRFGVVDLSSLWDLAWIVVLISLASSSLFAGLIAVGDLRRRRVVLHERARTR